MQRASFYFIGFRVSGVDWLFACLFFCFVVVLLVVQCAKQSFLLAGRGFSHIVYCFCSIGLISFIMAEFCKLSGYIIVCSCFLLLHKCCNVVCVVLLSCLDAAFYFCA